MIIRGDARHLPLADDSVDLIVTSPPYYQQRTYTDGGEHYVGQLGAEPTPAAYVDALVECTREMVRVLKPTGSLWVNLGDKYSQRVAVRTSSHQTGLFPGHPELRKSWRRDKAEALTRMPYQNVTDPATGAYVPEKSLIGIPWRYAIRCVDELGLILRAEVIWSKTNGMPESVTDRVRRSHETWFHFTLQPRYYAAIDEIREQHKGSGAGMTWSDRVSLGNPTYAPENGHLGATNSLRSMAGNLLGKLPGSVWTIATEPLKVPEHLGVDHYAAFPTEWPRRIIRGWAPPGGVVADPFGGTGTVALVAQTLGRRAISLDMSADYCRVAAWRTTDPRQVGRAVARNAATARASDAGSVTCQRCGVTLTGRSHARYCSVRCRVAAHRARQQTTA